MNLFDTHCHLDFSGYDEDRDAVIQRAFEAGVRQILIPGVDFASLERTQPLVQAYDHLVMAVGIHPNSTADWTDANLEKLRQAAADPKVVAIGEIGLDYYWDESPKEMQRRAFEAQLTLAAELELPVIIHNRDASEEVLPILESWVRTLPESLKESPGVLHSFSAPPEYADRALAAGFYLGFTGRVTYKKADELRSIAARVPKDRILIETDGPFLPPHPHRGKRNEPAYVALVAARIAGLHLMDSDTFAELSTANGQRLFRLERDSI